MADDFDEFYTAHVRGLTAQLYASIGDLAEAQDIVHLAGLTTAEVARECHAPESTVRSWLHRGRMTLMTQLAEEASR